MNDRYLFRGKREDNGKLVYGSLAKFNDATVIVSIFTRTADSEGKQRVMSYGSEEYKIIPETLGQATGRYDKKETLVYEADIVELKCHIYNASTKANDKVNVKAVIKWDECGMYYLDPLDRNNWCDDWNFQDDIGRFKIIGTIHDTEVK